VKDHLVEERDARGRRRPAKAPSKASHAAIVTPAANSCVSQVMPIDPVGQWWLDFVCPRLGAPTPMARENRADRAAGRSPHPADHRSERCAPQRRRDGPAAAGAGSGLQYRDRDHLIGLALDEDTYRYDLAA